MRVEPALLLYIVPRPSLFVCLFHFVVRVRARVIFFCGRIMHRSNYYDGPPGRNLCALGVRCGSTSWTLPLANNSNVTKDIMDPSGAKPKRTTTRRRKKKKKKNERYGRKPSAASGVVSTRGWDSKEQKHEHRNTPVQYGKESQLGRLT